VVPVAVVPVSLELQPKAKREAAKKNEGIRGERITGATSGQPA
jgi:hypothetical protein